ncbi:hypothetical protein BU14_0153s0013 [Porphyra umbilicalis]|uniref:Uncharacterized protein n=1 Tax=Porphyra umbilicalis TaxID=2786 RepID=A0A1X6P929_PORUM|nr:hypothetical protein BU14_0153s0013 [Porphyra umbilicalis]|eukprot:OSX77270.1 hypothetical protein BU14_0153s0013 [Porphyra umbilicalis]
MSDTRGEANASMENEAMESSEPTERSSHSCDKALISDDSSCGCRMADSTCRRRDAADPAAGKRSSSPAPRRRSRPCSVDELGSSPSGRLANAPCGGTPLPSPPVPLPSSGAPLPEPPGAPAEAPLRSLSPAPPPLPPPSVPRSWSPEVLMAPRPEEREAPPDSVPALAAAAAAATRLLRSAARALLRAAARLRAAAATQAAPAATRADRSSAEAVDPAGPAAPTEVLLRPLADPAVALEEPAAPGNTLEEPPVAPVVVLLPPLDAPATAALEERVLLAAGGSASATPDAAAAPRLCPARVRLVGVARVVREAVSGEGDAAVAVLGEVPPRLADRRGGATGPGVVAALEARPAEEEAAAAEEEAAAAPVVERVRLDDGGRSELLLPTPRRRPRLSIRAQSRAHPHRNVADYPCTPAVGEEETQAACAAGRASLAPRLSATAQGLRLKCTREGQNKHSKGSTHPGTVTRW